MNDRPAFLWPWPRVLAHRGGGTLAPENTIAGIDAGRAAGFVAVEFDAMLAADGEPVVIHDPTLERTTNGRGAVSDHRLVELQALDAGQWKDARFAGVRVPSLAQAVAHCRAHRVWMNVEIKPAPGHEARTGEVVALRLVQWFADVPADVPDGYVQRPLLSSFSGVALAAARRAAPALPRGFLFDVVPADWLKQLQALDCVALHCNHKHLSATLAAQVRSAGYGLFCYTVNDEARAKQLFAWGVDGFCTDRIDLIAPSMRP